MVSFFESLINMESPRERLKDSQKKRTGGQKCDLSGFPAFL